LNSLSRVYALNACTAVPCRVLPAILLTTWTSYLS